MGRRPELISGRIETAGETSQRMKSHDLALLATAALEDLKGRDIVEIDITEKSNIADAMVVATGTSKRHVKSLADQVRVKAKDAGEAPLGVEGEDAGEWVLVDLGDVIVHVMTEEMREFYALEKLWSVSAADEGLLSAKPESTTVQL